MPAVAVVFGLLCAASWGSSSIFGARASRAHGALATRSGCRSSGSRSSSRSRSAPACPTRRATTGCWRRSPGVAYLGGSACWTFAVRLGAVGIVTMLVATDGAIAATASAFLGERSACRSRCAWRWSSPACCSPPGPASTPASPGRRCCSGCSVPCRSRRCSWPAARRPASSCRGCCSWRACRDAPAAAVRAAAAVGHAPRRRSAT